MSLTDTAVRNLKPSDKPYKLADGGGMYLHAFPAAETACAAHACKGALRARKPTAPRVDPLPHA